MGLRIVFFGTPKFAATAARTVLNSHHTIIGAVAAPDRPSGRGRKITRGELGTLMTERGIPLLQPATLKDEEIISALKSFDADVFVVASYGLLLPEQVLDIPKLAPINAHGSLLPHLRGAAPVERALLAGDKATGISIQHMVKKLDAGPIYASEEIEIEPHHTGGTLREELADMAGLLIVEVLDALENGTATATPQDEEIATYAHKITRRDQQILWANSARRTEHRVRAFADYGGAFAFVSPKEGARRIKILAAVERNMEFDAKPGTVLDANSPDKLIVATGDGALELLRVQPEGKRRMTARDYLHGHQLKIGHVFGDSQTQTL